MLPNTTTNIKYESKMLQCCYMPLFYISLGTSAERKIGVQKCLRYNPWKQRQGHRTEDREEKAGSESLVSAVLKQSSVLEQTLCRYVEHPSFTVF